MMKIMRIIIIFLSFTIILLNNFGCANVKSTDVVQSIALGDTFSMFLMKNGELWACGANYGGQLGNNRIVHDPTAFIKVLDNVVVVSAGSGHAAAIKKDHSLWVWGSLGANVTNKGTAYDFKSTYEPNKIMDHVSSVDCGTNYVIAIKTDGSLWAWGRNDAGQLGDGTEIDHLIPEKIMENVKAISTGEFNSMALKKDGSLWAWGATYQSAKKDIRNDTPIKILDNVVSIASGEVSSMAIKSDGSLWAWGRNDYGALGDNTTEGSNVPIKVMDNVKLISAGLAYTMAIKTDDSLWGWGRNNAGQIGNNTIIDQHEPVKVMDNVRNVYVYQDRTMAITTNGDLWVWGGNYCGEFGDGTTKGSLIPKKITLPEKK